MVQLAVQLGRARESRAPVDRSARPFGYMVCNHRPHGSDRCRHGRTTSPARAGSKYRHGVTKDRRGGTKGRRERTKDDRAGTKGVAGETTSARSVTSSARVRMTSPSKVPWLACADPRSSVDVGWMRRALRAVYALRSGFSARSLEGDDDFRSPTPSSPPVGRGRNVSGPMSYSTSPTGGGEGVGDPIENPSMLRHGNPVRNG